MDTTQTPSTPEPTINPSKRLQFSIDLRWICLMLIIVICAMLALWRPWHHAIDANNRTISVSGDATIKAAPDEFGFYPSYEFREATKAAAISAATAKQTEITKAVKALGVKDEQIKADVNGYQDYTTYPSGIKPLSENDGNGYVYNLSMTITIPKLADAQKIQDYLASTSPTGSVTPYPHFSEAVQKKLDSQARDKATADARAKADQSAKNLGFKIVAVKSVNDGSSNMESLNMGMGVSVNSDAFTKSAAPSMAVQPGQNDISYSVSVVYYIR